MVSSQYKIAPSPGVFIGALLGGLEQELVYKGRLVGSGRNAVFRWSKRYAFTGAQYPERPCSYPLPFTLLGQISLPALKLSSV